MKNVPKWSKKDLYQYHRKLFISYTFIPGASISLVPYNFKCPSQLLPHPQAPATAYMSSCTKDFESCFAWKKVRCWNKKA